MLGQTIALLGLLATAAEGETERRTTQILEVKVRSETAHLQPNSTYWIFRKVLIPNECEYLTHDIELLEEFPEQAPGAHRKIVDWVRCEAVYLPSGFSAVLSIGVSPYRPADMNAGPAWIAVKLSVTVNCTSQALDQLTEQLKSD